MSRPCYWLSEVSPDFPLGIQTAAGRSWRQAMMRADQLLDELESSDRRFGKPHPAAVELHRIGGGSTGGRPRLMRRWELAITQNGMVYRCAR